MFVLLVSLSSVVLAFAAIPVRAVPAGGIVWANSEQLLGHDQSASGAAADGSGVYAVGYDSNTLYSYWEWHVEKRNATTGAILWSFSEHITSVYGNDAASAVAVDGTGVYIVGYDANTAGTGHFEWRIEKRNATTGAFITGFGTGGAISEHISNRDDAAYAVTVSSTGLYVAGYDENTAGNIPEWRIERRNQTTGAILWSMSEQISSSSYGDVAFGVAADASGVYVVGYDNNTGCGNLTPPPSSDWRVEKRSIASGALITSFGTGGAISEHVSSECDQATATTVDSTGLYVVGFDQNTAGNWDEWRIEKRSTTTGAFISSFGTGGAISEHISPYRDDAYAAVVDSSGLYVAGKDENSPSYPEWRVEKRNLSTGATIWSVSEDIGPGSPGNQAYGDAVDGTGLYVVGSDSAVGNGYPEWRIEKRVLNPNPFTVTPQTPTNGVSVNSAYQLLSVKVTTNSPQIPTSSANVTLYVNGTAICINQTPSALGIVTCPYNIEEEGLYYWNGTAQTPSTATINPQTTFTFTANMVQAITLNTGWNLISLPLMPTSTQIGNVLASQIARNDFTAVWSYQNGKWNNAMLSGGKLTGTLTTMQDGYGYWIYMTSPDTLYVNGYVIPLPPSLPPSYSLAAGWNLLGFKPQPTVASETVSTYLSSINGEYAVNNVWLYDNPTGSWIRATGSTMIPVGEALWVYMTTPATLRP